jgi:glycosyltransferase involved in cell wall biosynthesis
MDHRFIRNRDIVLFSFQAWESEIGFNFKDMAYELARYNRVLFINRAADRNSVMRAAFRGRSPKKRHYGAEEKDSLQEVQHHLWLLNPRATLESINWSPSYTLFGWINRVNNRRLAIEIKEAISRLDLKDIIFINDNDFFRGLYQQEMVPIQKYIFYIRDYLTIQPFFKKFGPRLEREMIQKADLVVANSAYLAEYARLWNPNSFDIGQGCHLESFVKENLSMPQDMEAIPRPVIGYCGSVTAMRLDSAVLDQIARSLPGCSLVLVGPLDPFYEKSDLKKYKNVFMLGGKPPGTIQDYIAHFDICINPQAINQLTIGNYPRKIDEYLAAGKPVVATATEAMKMFSAHTYLCSSAEDYVVQIKKVLADHQAFSTEEKERRRGFALEHTWENSIGLLGDAYFQAELKQKIV